jgi:hypothetical protein
MKSIDFPNIRYLKHLKKTSKESVKLNLTKTHLTNSKMLFLYLCDDILNTIGDYLRLAQEAKEREFQCSLVTGRRKTFFLDYDDDDKWEDRSEDSPKHQTIEFYEKSLHCAIQNESHLHYHPTCNLEDELVKRYQHWIGPDPYGEGAMNLLCPCNYSSMTCNSCMRVRYVMSQEQRSHANARKTKTKNKGAPITNELCIYNRVRTGCPSCKDDSLLCDYCCRYGSKKKTRMKWGFMKYTKGKRRFTTVDQPIMNFNTYVPTHKTPPGPGSRPRRRR